MRYPDASHGALLEVGTGFHQELTGRENVYLKGAMLGMKRREIARKLDDIVAFAEIEEFLIDSPEAYDKCLEFVSSLVPQLASRVRCYQERAPIFEATGIEKEIEMALRRRVWLRSGGYIVIDHTEALVAIDVNTGKYVGKRDFEETVLKINLEAVTEVVRQIRLRDLGGIIIIDFIDMELASGRRVKSSSRALLVVTGLIRTLLWRVSKPTWLHSIKCW